MAGQIVKRGERTWMVRVFLGRDPVTGKRKYHNHTVHGTKKDAQAYLTGALREQDLGRFQEPTRMALGEFLARWLEEAARPKLRERTFNDYTEVIRRYIHEPLGHFKLPQLTPLAIQGFYGKLRERGLSPATIRKAHVVLSSSLDQAVRWGMLAHNPTHSVQLPRANGGPRKDKMLVLTPEEAGWFLDAARSSRWGVLFSLALQTGARPSEYLALQWSDIDWAGKAIRICRSLFRKRTGGGWRFEETKTRSSARSITVPDSLLDELREHAQVQAREKQVFHQDYHDHNLVFAGYKGEPLDGCNLLQRYLRPVLAAAGLDRRLNLYSLRHTHCTLLLIAGVHPKIVAERAGHSSIQLTPDVYSHVIPSLQQVAVDKLESLLKPIFDSSFR